MGRRMNPNRPLDRAAGMTGAARIEIWRCARVRSAAARSADREMFNASAG